MLQQVFSSVSWQALKEPLVTLFSLVAIWLLYRTNRWLATQLERERTRFDKQMSAQHEREMRRQNETVKTLSEAYALGEPPTLDDLLSSAERDFSVRSSVTPFETPAAKSRTTRIPPKPSEPEPPDDEWIDITEEVPTIQHPHPPPNRRR